MSVLHHAYISEDLVRFKLLLQNEGETYSTNFVPKSKHSARADVNLVDHLGRTVLHLAASEGKLDYVEALLSQKSLDVTKPDRESGWTALHRALYAGQALVARAIISHHEIRGASLRALLNCSDLESNTAFDVYNSTITGVNPLLHTCAKGGSDFFSFGSNANHTLGFSDADDRASPERVLIKRPTKLGEGISKFRENRIRDVQMSKYHTLVVTTDLSSNLYSCGFNKNGRLGVLGGTQFTLQPVHLPGQVLAVAAAQDHSLAVTDTGDLYSWGLQERGQLGYELESGSSFSPLPRRVIKLAKESVIGVCASSVHSVCFTDTSLYSWGQNNGQLGYPVNNSEDEIVRSPRKVTVLSAAVKQVTATRFATVCLLESDDVLVLTNHGYFKLALQLDRFASQYQVFRPRQSYAPSKVVKVVSGSTTIGVMTSMGDLFSFTLDESTSSTKASTLAKLVRPTRVWSLRKKHNAIRDCSIGQDGSIIMCTESGSVLIGTKRIGKQRNDATKADYKFSRVAGITRVVQVRASEHGAFGLIRDDVSLMPVVLDSAELAEDLSSLLPYNSIVSERNQAGKNTSSLPSPDERGLDTDGDVEPAAKLHTKMYSMLRDVDFRESLTFERDSHDVVISLGDSRFPAHMAICCARSSSLESCLVGKNDMESLRLLSEEDIPVVLIEDDTIDVVSLTVVMHWLYTDILLVPWVSGVTVDYASGMAIRQGVQKLSSILGLKALNNAMKRNFVLAPASTLHNDISRLRTDSRLASLADVCLCLADGEISTHSAILMARSEFFRAVMSGAWSGTRQADSSNNLVEVNLRHLTREVIDLVLDHIFTDGDTKIFDGMDFSDLDTFLDLVISVLAAATELLLPRLKQACQAVLRRYVHRKNVSIILYEADLYSADSLKDSCLDYCTKNLQQLLETNLLLDLSDSLMRDLEHYIAGKQMDRLPVSKSGELLSRLVQRNPSVKEDSERMKQDYLQALQTTLSRLDSKHATRPHLAHLNKERKSSEKRSPVPPKLSVEPAMIFEMDDCMIPETVSNVYQPLDSSSELALLQSGSNNLEHLHAPPVNVKDQDQEFVVAARRSSRKSDRIWAESTSPVPVTDLRTVLDQRQKNAVINPPVSATAALPRVSQRERKRHDVVPNGRDTVNIFNSQGTSPWGELSPKLTPSFKTIADTQRAESESRATDSGQSRRTETPIRKASTPRNIHSGDSPASYSKIYASPSSTPGSVQKPLSLAEIIASEEDTKTKIIEYNAKRSMKEIQEQEAFEQWFQDESARIQREEAASAALAARLSQTKGTPKAKKATPRKGRNKQIPTNGSHSESPVTALRDLKASASEFQPRSSSK